MEKEIYDAKYSMRKIADSQKPFTADELSGYTDIIRLFKKENPQELDSEIKQVIDNLPSSHNILNEMNKYELRILSKTISFLWQKITGEKLSEIERTIHSNEAEKLLDGCYWLLPNEILVSGFNHYDAAKKHKGIICSLLNINKILFEKALAGSPEKVIEMIMKNHGTRVVIDRENSSVYMQCSEKGWPLARSKIKKMHHKDKILRVLDKSKPYVGWDSGVPVIIH